MPSCLKYSFHGMLFTPAVSANVRLQSACFNSEDNMKNWIYNNRGFIIFLLCFGIFRTAVADWNPIPSGSMRPSLLEGDVVLVNRLAYDFKFPLSDIIIAHLGDPKRGDIVTFSSPKDGTRLIKRLIALPGDKVEMRNEVLYINNQIARYTRPEMLLEQMENGISIPAMRLTESIGDNKRRVQFLQGIPAKNTFGPIVVPAGMYLALGDNRDNSADSRYIGLVPRHLLIGKAERILVSANILGNWAPRLDRLGQRL
jgi:signal peptidase I